MSVVKLDQVQRMASYQVYRDQEVGTEVSMLGLFFFVFQLYHHLGYFSSKTG